MRMDMIKRFLRVVMGGVFMLAGAGIAVAEEAPMSISVDQAIEMALKSSENYSIRDFLAQKARSIHRAGVSNLLPQVSASSTWTRNVGYPQDTLEKYDMNTGVTVTQVVYAFGRLTSAISAAEKNIAVSLLEKDAVKRDIVYLTKTVFYGTLAAEETWMALKESLGHASNNKMVLEDRFSMGRPAKADMLKTAADVAARIPSVKAAEAYYQALLTDLKTLLGVPYAATIVLLGDLNVPPVRFDEGSLVKELATNEPTLKALEKRVDLAEDMVKVKKTQFYPQIDAFSSVSAVGSSGKSYIGREATGEYAFFGFKLSVPVWNGGLTQEELRQSRFDRDIAKLNLARAQKELSAALVKALDNYEEYLAVLKANTDSVRIAEDSYQMVEGLFRTGQAGVSQLNDAELLWVSQRLSKIETAYKVRILTAEIEKLSATEVHHE